MQYLLFLRESFSSEFHVFVTFQTSQLDTGIWRVPQAPLLYRRCVLALQSFILNLAKDYSPEPNLCFLLLRLLIFLPLHQAEKCSEIGTVSKYKTCLIIAKVTCTSAWNRFAAPSPKSYLNLFELYDRFRRWLRRQPASKKLFTE